MTLTEKIQQAGLQMTVRPGAKEDPNMPDMDGWTITIRVYGHQMTIPFYMGKGHNGRTPGAEEVLEALCSDASTVDNARGFEDWCNELGFDPNSRKDERTYKAVERQTQRLRELLGIQYDEFVYAEH